MGASEAEEVKILSPTVNINSDTCLYLYLYCKNCTTPDTSDGYSGYGYAFNEEGTDIIGIQTLPDDIDSGDGTFLLNKDIIDSGFAMATALPQGTYRVEITAGFKLGWIIVHKIETVGGSCNKSGKYSFKDVQI